MSDETKGGLTLEIDRDDVRHLMKNGTTQVVKDIGPIQVKLRCHQRLEAEVMVAGRHKDDDPEVIE